MIKEVCVVCGGGHMSVYAGAGACAGACAGAGAGACACVCVCVRARVHVLNALTFCTPLIISGGEAGRSLIAADAMISGFTQDHLV